MDERFIIEHQTRGILREQDYDDMAARNYLGWVSKWSWSKPRSEAMVLTAKGTRMAWSRIDPKVRREASIRRYGSWSHVEETELNDG